GMRLRLHGDPRLERILFTGQDFVFTGFDGPPWLASAERTFHIHPLHDAAAMVCGLLLFPGEALAGHGDLRAVSPDADARAAQWADLSAGLFLDGYLDVAEAEPWMSSGEEERARLLESFLLERLAHEVL